MLFYKYTFLFLLFFI